MADDFDFGAMPEQVDPAAKLRREMLIRQLASSTLPKVPPTYKRSPLAAVFEFLSARGAKKDLEALDAKELGRARATQQADQQGIQALLQGMAPQSVPQAGPPMEGMGGLPNIQQPGDVRGSITRALASPLPRTSKMGGEFLKLNKDVFSPPPKPLDEPSLLNLMGPDGKPINAVRTKDANGSINVQFPPVPSSQVNINTSGKAGKEVLEQKGKYYTAGGKGFEKAEAAVNSLQNTQSLLTTLASAPQMGAGAEAFQAARKWAQTLGMPVSDATTPTEIAKMQLGQKTLDRLGGLGAQVSDSDRKFMLETQGSLGNDAAAVRKMLMIEAKYLMQLITRHNAEVEPVRKEFEGVVDIPGRNFNFTVPEPLIPEMDALMLGQPLVQPAPPAGIRRK